MTRWGDLVSVRPFDAARPRERVLVLDSWASSWLPHARPALTRRLADQVVEDYLARADQVLVAVVPGLEHRVCGWVARLEPGALSYLYVMHDYRRQGIGERLMRAAELEPRGARWRYVFSTPRLRQLCRPDPRRPHRVPWKGVPHGQEGTDRSPRERRAT